MSKSGAPWCHGPHSNGAALTAEEIAGLARDFGFAREALVVLSNGLGRALDPQSRPRGIADPTRASEKGWETLNMLRADVIAAQKKIDAARDRFDKLWISDRTSKNSAEKLEFAILDGLVSARREVQYIERLIRLRERQGPEKVSILAKGARSRGRAKDLTRYAVCSAIFEFWARAGRPLTYTTDAISSERKGRLVEFVNAVVPLITEPVTTLSGHTIIDDLETFKASNPEIIAAIGQV